MTLQKYITEIEAFAPSLEVTDSHVCEITTDASITVTNYDVMGGHPSFIPHVYEIQILDCGFIFNEHDDDGMSSSDVYCSLRQLLISEFGNRN